MTMAVFTNTARNHRHLYRCALFLYFLTFLVILPLVCKDMKFSVYYGMIWPRNTTEDTNNLKQENDQRYLMAQQYLRFTKFEKIAPPKNGSDIIVTVITVSRKIATYNPRYLTQTVGKLSEQLMSNMESRSFSYGIMICNVDNFPENYEEANKLSGLFHTVVKYKNNQLLEINKFEKEKQDYSYCLEQSLVYNPKFILLMEDDAYPTSDMLPVLEYSIQNIFEGKHSMFSRQPNEVAYLKLYHPERLLNFISSEYYRLFELASAILILFTTFALLNDRVLHIHTSWRFYAITGTYIVLLALVIGRQNFLALRGMFKHSHSYVPAPSCCTPANVYSYSGAVAMISSFAGKPSFAGRAKDMLLDEFLVESNYRAVYVEPNTFQHIGQYSSLRVGSILNPYVV